MATSPDIFAYYDYRKFLRDVYEARKAENPAFSYRYIGSKAGFSSSSFFKKVVDGESNISMSIALGLAQVFRLPRAEREYFELLVLFDQARTQEERRSHLERIVGLRKGHVESLDAEKFEFFDRWYYVAVHELIDFYPYRGDDAELASLVSPPIRPAEARRAIETLERLGLIRCRPDGRWEKTSAALTTGYEVFSPVIQGFQKAAMDLAKEAIDRHPREEREIATLTLSVSDDLMKRIQDRLRHVRREILEMARQDQDAERVWQLNMQVFPLSRRWEEG